MSIDVMNLVWRSTLEGSSKRFVLLALADRADDDGYCWPGVKTLVEKTGLSERTVHRVISELAASRLLLREERRTQRGGSDTNGYWINLEALQGMQRPRKSTRGRHPLAATGGGAMVTPPGCHGDRGEGVMVAPNTSVETTDRPQREVTKTLGAPAPRPQPPAACSNTRRPRPWADDPEAWIEDQVYGLWPGEEHLVEAMLERDCHPRMIVNTITKQRAG